MAWDQSHVALLQSLHMGAGPAGCLGTLRGPRERLQCILPAVQCHCGDPLPPVLAQGPLSLGSRPAWDNWALRGLPEAGGSLWVLAGAAFLSGPASSLQILTRTASSTKRTCKGSSFGCSTATTCPRTCSLTSPAACVPGAAGWVCPWKAGRIRCPEGWVLGLEATTPCFLSYLQDLDSLPGSPEP